MVIIGPNPCGEITMGASWRPSPTVDLWRSLSPQQVFDVSGLVILEVRHQDKSFDMMRGTNILLHQILDSEVARWILANKIHGFVESVDDGWTILRSWHMFIPCGRQATLFKITWL